MSDGMHPYFDERQQWASQADAEAAARAREAAATMGYEYVEAMFHEAGAHAQDAALHAQAEAAAWREQQYHAAAAAAAGGAGAAGTEASSAAPRPAKTPEHAGKRVRDAPQRGLPGGRQAATSADPDWRACSRGELG